VIAFTDIFCWSCWPGLLVGFRSNVDPTPHTSHSHLTHHTHITLTPHPLHTHPVPTSYITHPHTHHTHITHHTSPTSYTTPPPLHLTHTHSYAPTLHAYLTPFTYMKPSLSVMFHKSKSTIGSPFLYQYSLRTRYLWGNLGVQIYLALNRSQCESWLVLILILIISLAETFSHWEV
jgi:hypothetical protein